MTSKQIRIETTEDGETLTVKPAGFLGKFGEQTFDCYLEACREAGCTYDAGTKTQRISVRYAPELINSLISRGFGLSADDDVARVLSSFADDEETNRKKEKELVRLGLYPFQAKGVIYLQSNRRALLSDEMGLGKTVQVLMALPYPLGCKSVIVVCPAFLRSNWRDECKKWRPDLNVVVVKNKKSFRQPLSGEVLVCGYEIIPDNNEKWADADVILVGDEIHYTKNSKALRTQRFRKLRDIVLKNGGSVWGLTGTPILNQADELWGILSSLDLHREAYGSWRNFVSLFGGYQSPFGFEWGEPKDGCDRGLNRVSLRRERTEVLPDLPAKSFKVIEVEVDTKTKELADEAMGTVGDVSQILDLPIDNIAQMSAARKALAIAKIPSLMKLVEMYENEKQTLVVFSAHKGPIESFSFREGWGCITGDTPTDVRAILVENFQKGKLKGLALTIQAGGVGLTLTRSHHAVFIDRTWTPAQNWQAEDRICRIGQERGCMYTFLIADHDMDRIVSDALESKRVLIKKAVRSSPSNEESSYRRFAKLIKAANKGDNDVFDSGVSVRKESPRKAETRTELWAAQALLTLSGVCDGAVAQDNCGFNSRDSSFGKSLARQLQTRDGLSDKQWSHAIKICKKYHRQVGEPPNA